MTNRGQADEIVKERVLWSMGAGLIPIPIADIVAVTAIQVDMIRYISQIYKVDFADSRTKSLITALSGSTLSKLAANAIKLIPGVGSILGGISMAALSGASTYAVGQVFIEHFEKGGNFFDFDSDKFKDFYEGQFEKGKKFAQEWQKQQETEKKAEKKTENPKNQAKNDTNEDPMQKLQQLSDMYAKGLIDEQEYKRFKSKILGEM